MENENKEFDYSKLKGKIIEKFGTQTNFLELLDMSEVTFIKTMKCDRFFNQCEIMRIINLLNIDKKNISDYFFCTKS